MRQRRDKRTTAMEYDRRRSGYKQLAPPPKREQASDEGPQGPRSYAVGQVSQDYGETRREATPPQRDDGLHPQRPRRKPKQREGRTAIGPVGDMSASGE